MLLIHHAAQLLTLWGEPRARRGREMAELGLIRDGAVLMDGDRIVRVGTTDAVTRALPAVAPGAGGREEMEEIDASGCLVTPGLVDSHTHLLFAVPRLDDFERRIRGESYEQIAARGGGIRSSVDHLRAADDARLLAHAVAWLARARRHGTTTIEIKSGYGLSLDQELRMLRIAGLAAHETGFDAALTFLGAHTLPVEWEGRRELWVEGVIHEMLPGLSSGQAEFCDVFCDSGGFDRRESERILLAARDRGFKLKVHAEQLTHTGATELGIRLGAVSVDHLEYTTVEDHRRLASASTVATLLPGVSLFLATRWAPGRALVDAGAAVALASDFNPGSSPMISMPLMMALGCTGLRLSPAEVWTAATINGAAALDRAGTCGMLRPGWRADVALYGVDDYRAVPYFAGEPLCRMVIQAGRRVNTG